MGTSVNIGSGETFCCEGFQRLVVGLAAPPPDGGSLASPDIALEFTFRTADVGNVAMTSFQRVLGDETDRIVIEADLGSYRVRPVAGVRIKPPLGTWSVAAWRTGDPCTLEETFWRTLSIGAGPWVPPPFYHRLRILGGVVAWRGRALVLGAELAMPGSGASLTSPDGAVVQVGFRI